MSIVSTSRASYNRPSISRLGKRPDKSPKKVATETETHKINKAIVQLNEAKTAVSEAAFLAKVSEAFKLSREVWRGRNA